MLKSGVDRISASIKAGQTLRSSLCWKRGTYAHTYAHTYTPMIRIVISAPAEAGLALWVIILPLTSSFLRSFYLLDSSTNTLWSYDLVYQEEKELNCEKSFIGKQSRHFHCALWTPHSSTSHERVRWRRLRTAGLETLIVCLLKSWYTMTWGQIGM